MKLVRVYYISKTVTVWWGKFDMYYTGLGWSITRASSKLYNTYSKCKRQAGEVGGVLRYRRSPVGYARN